MKKERAKIDESLKAFMEQHFDFHTMKKMGFYPKGMRKDDYKGQSERVCYFFGFKSVFEYITIKVRAHISVITATFTCPICECEQLIPDNDKGRFTFKCKGCRRKLLAFSRLDGYEITEVGGFKEETKTYLREDEKSFVYNPNII